jgi:hypothetical protein
MTRPGERGSTVVEVLVATALIALVMGVAYGSLAAQMRRHAGQTLLSESLHAARTGFTVLTEQLALAGFGVPTATTPSRAPMLVTAEATRLSFWASPDAAHTYLGSAAALGARSINVLSAAGLSAGTRLYVADATRWYSGTVSAVRGTTIDVTPALTYNFAAGSPVAPVQLVTFEYADGALRRNGRALIPNVTALTFSYDRSTPAAVRLVDVALTVRTRAPEPGGGGFRTVTLNARVTPVNLGL